MPRFLVVDDDDSTVSGLTRLLADDGHEVASFTHGADAVKALACEAFDAVLTDLEMPHVNGHAVVEATRRHHPTACLIVATANPEKAAELAAAGVCLVADKPIDYDEVTRSVRACRKQGGPGLHGRCHHRSRPEELLELRRK